jgi:hypothetical protein
MTGISGKQRNKDIIMYVFHDLSSLCTREFRTVPLYQKNQGCTCPTKSAAREGAGCRRRILDPYR